MNGLAATAGALVPWAFILGFFGLIMKVRLSGDPALWKRVEDLEKKIDEQQASFKAEMDRERKERTAELDRERAECADRIGELEGFIRQLQQQQQSLGNLKPLEGALNHAFPLTCEPDKDRDLIEKLDQQPRKRRRR